MASLPLPFTQRMEKLLGDGFESFYREVTFGKPTRAFFTKSGIDFCDISQFSAEKIDFCDGYYFDADAIGKSPIHHGGGIYIQDPSAMATVASLGDRTFKNVLDMCASPGGKSLGVHTKIEDGGVLVSNEYVSSRCKTLVGNLERFGVKNAIVTSFDMTERNELCDIYESFFDLVICDAPCSGEGMFRKYPEEALSEWSVENIILCAQRQRKILENAAGFVSPGGIILYSTCTFSFEENEMAVDEFLKNHSDFRLIEADESVKKATLDGIKFDGCVAENIQFCRRFYPHISKGEGQFIALLEKCNGAITKQKDKYKSPLSPLNDVEKKAASEFFKKNLAYFDEKCVFKYNDNIVFADFDAKIPSKRVFSCGAKLGEVIKGRFEPHHHFYKCFGDCFKNKVCLDEAQAQKYLHGEGIDVDAQNGYAAVFYKNLVLGGGKVVDGFLKNHYPKGLRNI